jgi:hypothetical protein
MDRRATRFRRNIAVAHIEDSLLHEILANVKSEICSFPGYYAADSDNSLLKFRDNLCVTSPRAKKYKKNFLYFLAHENDTDKFYQNFGKELSLYAAYYSRRAQTSYALWQTPEITHMSSLFYILCVQFNTYIHTIGGGHISVSIATRYGLEGPGIDSRWGRDFPQLSRPALEPTQPPIQWVPVLFPGAWR